MRNVVNFTASTPHSAACRMRSRATLMSPSWFTPTSATIRVRSRFLKSRRSIGIISRLGIDECGGDGPVELAADGNRRLLVEDNMTETSARGAPGITQQRCPENPKATDLA